MSKFIATLLLLWIFCFPVHTKAQTETSEYNAVAAMADSIMNLKYFEYNHRNLRKQQTNKYGYAPDSVPVFKEDVIAKRLAKLDAKSPLNLVYNKQVKGYIDMYTLRKRDQVERMLGLSHLYYPLFEEKLDKYNIPLELKHLAVVESALNAHARSRAGAVGLWQFMYGTGKMFGLETTSYVDDRNDPVKSTEAACRYLKYLYGMFGDWHLVLAAYNAGPGTVNKAIRRSGGKTDYWELLPYLPTETNGYVPAFIAANYVMNYYQEHNLYPATPLYYYNSVDTVYISQHVSLTEVASFLQVDEEEIKFLNPVYRNNVVPGGDVPMPVCMPRYCISFFTAEEKELYAVKQTLQTEKEDIKFEQVKVKKIHTVKSGEHLSAIARSYGCSVTDIRSWNNLSSNAIHPGQKLSIMVTDQKPVHVNSANNVKPVQSATAGEFKYYTVQPGDTLWDIAGRNKGVTVEEIMRLNNISDGNQLKPGMKLKIGSAG